MLDREFRRQAHEVTSCLADQLDPDFPSQAEFMCKLGRPCKLTQVTFLIYTRI